MSFVLFVVIVSSPPTPYTSSPANALTPCSSSPDPQRVVADVAAVVHVVATFVGLFPSWLALLH